MYTYEKVKIAVLNYSYMIIKRQIGEKEQVVFEIKDNEVKIKSGQDAEEFVEDFFNTPKLKRKLSPKELKKIILEQYDEEIP